jgi:hypothetical protein
LLLFALVGVPLFICVGLAGCYLGLRSQWAVRMPDILLRTHDGVRLCDRSAPTALGVFEACGDAQEYNCSLTTFGAGRTSRSSPIFKSFGAGFDGIGTLLATQVGGADV